MTINIEYQDHLSILDCENNPNKLYVFGDNLKRYGKGGQAVIRDCENAIGIATKYEPTNRPEAFFKGWETEKVLKDIMDVIFVYCEDGYDTLVLPLDGIGTGRANLKEHAPDILRLINKVFYPDE